MKTRLAPATLSTLIATTLLGALGICSSALCSAADSSDVPQLTVKYADINITSPQGAETLYRRIRLAALQVCETGYHGTRDLMGRERVADCVHKAMRNAVTQVGEPALVSIYNAKNQPFFIDTHLAAKAQ